MNFDFYSGLSLVMSAATITGQWLAGSKWRYTWALSFFNQWLWLWWICGTGNYGLLPITITFLFIAVCNHRRWVNASV